MALRVTRSGMYEQMRSLLDRGTRQLAQLQEQLGTLRRINRPSDDPLGAGRALELRADRASYRRYLDNIGKAQSAIDHAAATLQSMSGAMARVRALTMQAASPDVSGSTLAAIADEVDSILRNIVSDANTMHDGRYIFAGTATDTKPFVTDSATGENIGQVTYQGDLGARWVTVGEGARIQINENGIDVFMARGPGADLFSVIAEVRDTTANDAGLSDAELTDRLSAKLADVDAVHNDLLESLGRLAGRASSLELRSSLYEEAEIAATAALSMEEDADVAQVIYDLQLERNQFEALLAGSTALLKPTLMDFLV